MHCIILWTYSVLSDFWAYWLIASNTLCQHLGKNECKVISVVLVAHDVNVSPSDPKVPGSIPLIALFYEKYLIDSFFFFFFQKKNFS